MVRPLSDPSLCLPPHFRPADPSLWPIESQRDALGRFLAAVAVVGNTWTFCQPFHARARRWWGPPRGQQSHGRSGVNDQAPVSRRSVLIKRFPAHHVQHEGLSDRATVCVLSVGLSQRGMSVGLPFSPASWTNLAGGPHAF